MPLCWGIGVGEQPAAVRATHRTTRHCRSILTQDPTPSKQEFISDWSMPNLAPLLIVSKSIKASMGPSIPPRSGHSSLRSNHILCYSCITTTLRINRKLVSRLRNLSPALGKITGIQSNKERKSVMQSKNYKMTRFNSSTLNTQMGPRKFYVELCFHTC